MRTGSKRGKEVFTTPKVISQTFGLDPPLGLYPKVTRASRPLPHPGLRCNLWGCETLPVYDSFFPNIIKLSCHVLSFRSDHGQFHTIFMKTRENNPSSHGNYYRLNHQFESYFNENNCPPSEQSKGISNNSNHPFVIMINLIQDNRIIFLDD